MDINVFPNGPFMVNTYIISEGNEAVIIDPGSHLDELFAYINKKNLIPQAIFATHGHIDHVAGVHKVQEKFSIPFYIHPGEQAILETIPMQAELFGVPGTHMPSIDREIKEDSTITEGGMTFTCLLTPGHSPGSISFYINDVLFSGDALFNLSIGRTDLPGGDYGVLINGIKSKLLTLPGSTRVLCGHGPETSIDYEKNKNPFLR